MFRLETLPAALFTAGILAAMMPAHADELADLKAAVQQLQAEVQQLKAQKAAPAPSMSMSMPAAAAPAGAVVVTATPAPAPLGMNAGAALTPIQNVMSVNVAGNTFTLYGDVDQYFNDMRSNGQSIKALQDGALLRSRMGMIFSRDFGGGYVAKAQVEQSLNFENGNETDTSAATSAAGTTTSGRLFDRQAWAGLASPYGEFRVGRQNTAIFYAGNYVDYTERTMGSVVNNFGVPSRYDGDIAYIAPRIAGLQMQAHIAVGAGNQSATTSMTNGAVLQLGADYIHGPWRLGYAGLDARSTVGAGNVAYHDVYANYDYGRGTVYANFVRSNNAYGSSLSTTGGNVLSNNSQLAVTAPAAYYDVYQISADFKVTPALRVGALYGSIRDDATSNGDATGGSVGAYWDAFPNVTVYGLIEEMNNSAAAHFGFSGSGGLTKSFSTATVTGQRVEGLQIGAVYRF